MTKSGYNFSLGSKGSEENIRLINNFSEICFILKLSRKTNY